MYNTNITNNNTVIITGPGSTSGSTLTNFYRTPGKSVLALLAAGGSGGSSGWADVAGATTTPGGGGGAASAGFIFSPSYLLPSILSISVGAGGEGGNASRLASNDGSAGTLSAIYTQNVSSALWVASAPTGGTAATTSAAGAGGTAGSITGGFNSMGLFKTIPNLSGVSGNTTGAASNTTSSATVFSGGAGGAGITNTNIAAAGGGIQTSGIDIGVAGTAGPTVALMSQCRLFDPYIQNSSKGGCGGGSSSAAPGSAGAPGNFGSGGGGGGASNSAASNSGAGGNGGPGVIIIVEI